MNSTIGTGTVEKIQQFLRLHLSGKRAIVGVSGGIDSALVLKLLSISLDEGKVNAFFLPDGKGTSNEENDIDELSAFTGIAIEKLDIHDIVSAFLSTLHVTDRVALGNIKSRVRMSVLYYEANVLDGLVVGTTNKSEYYTGYFTKFGDGGCDLEPILHLSKTEIRELAVFLGLPKRIVDKPPSAGLWPGQSDEEELGVKYDDIDSSITNLVELRKPPSNRAEIKVSELIRASEHKRRLPESML